MGKMLIATLPFSIGVWFAGGAFTSTLACSAGFVLAFFFGEWVGRVIDGKD